jgi:oxygen-dependent protoporphyrinogen oxidase
MATIGIVGGGIAGLGAAWTALEAGHEVVLFERNADLGGRCRTHEWNGEWLIRGAAAFVPGERETVELSEKLGIHQGDNLQSEAEGHQFKVLHPTKGPTLVNLDVPSVLKSDVIPFAEKAKLAGALPKMIRAFLNAEEDDPTSVATMDDLNACEYFRRFSPALVDYILEPIMNMYAGYGEDDYSMAYMGWMLGNPRAFGTMSEAAWTYADRGVGRLTQELEVQLSRHPKCTLHLGAEVSDIRVLAESPTVRYRAAGSLTEQAFDRLIVAVPGSAVPQIVSDLPEPQARFFDQVEYVSHHIIHMLIDNPEGDNPNLMLPTSEGFEAASNIDWWPSSEDDAKSLFYAEVKGKFGGENVHQDDEFFLNAVWEDACRAVPALKACKRYEWYVERNELALCSRRKGYTTALKSFRNTQPIENVRFAGDYLITSTVGKAMRSGIDAAEDLIS